MVCYGRIIVFLFLAEAFLYAQVDALQCFECQTQSTVDGCTKISACDPGKICMLQRTVDAGTKAVSYETLCKDENECYNEMNKYQTVLGSIVGRKREMHQVVSDQGECLLQCCNDDTCNNGCLAGPTTLPPPTTTMFNIPTPPPTTLTTTTTPKPTTTTTQKPTTTTTTTQKPTTTTTKATTTTTKATTTTTKATTTTTKATTTTTKATTTTTKATTTTTKATTTPTTTTSTTTKATTPTTTTIKTTTPKPITCDHGSYAFDGGCYMFPRQEMSFREAEAFCASHGARIVHVDSAKENDFLKQIMRSKHQYNQFWLGITDVKTENTWLFYDDNTPVQFFDWMPGEPDGKQLFDGTSEADCAVFDPFADFQWRDEECSPYQFSVPICEKRYGKT